MRRIAAASLSTFLLAVLAFGQEPKGNASIAAETNPTPPSPNMIRLIAPLDEPEFYCLDIPGYGPNVQLKSPLTAHTLKAFGSDDQMWVLDYPAKGQIYAPAYKLCIQAERAAAGTSLMLKKASDSPLQRFSFAKNGTIALSDHSDIGIAAASGEGTPARGPSHVVRKLGLAKLSDTPAALKSWKLVKSADSWPE